MIDEQSGALALDDGTHLGAGLTQDAFTASTLGAAARPGVQNEPWRSWVVPELVSSGQRFRGMVCFSDGMLGMIDLVAQLPDPRLAWYETTPESEQTRRSVHDAWVEGALGPPRIREEDRAIWTVPGCEVVSLLDLRAMSAAIHLRFNWEVDDGEEP